MRLKRDLAIILKVIPHEERNRIVTALTEQHGVVSALARNAIQSRRFGGTLDLFAASEWTFMEKSGAELLRLDGAEIRRSYEGLRKDFERLAIAGVMSELLLRVAPKQDPCIDLFKLHANALAYLEEQAIEGRPNTDSLPLLNGYLTKLLQWSGNQPQLNQCFGCQTPIERLAPEQSVSCVVADAAWLCPPCRLTQTEHVRDRQGQSFNHSSLRVSARAILDFRMNLYLPIRQISDKICAPEPEQRELFRFLEALAAYHLPGFDQAPLKGLRFLNIQSILPSAEKNLL